MEEGPGGDLERRLEPQEAYAEQTHSIESLSREVEVMLQFKDCRPPWCLDHPKPVATYY